MNITCKEKVLSRYPNAYAEYLSSTSDIHTVWNMSHKDREELNKKYWPNTFGRILLGMEATEDRAWKDAVRSIELHEGISLPVKG